MASKSQIRMQSAPPSSGHRGSVTIATSVELDDENAQPADGSPKMSFSSSQTSGLAKVPPRNSLSEREVLERQRYFHNSSFASAQSQLNNLIPAAPKPITAKGRNTTIQLREFIIEQRKIIASFRSQPWPMYMKIEAIRNYKANILTYVPQLGTIDAFRDKSSRAVYRERQRLKSILRTFTIWRYIIKKIEGNFGTSVGSYFRLVRWLCVLNFSTFLLIFMLVILPQITLGHGLDVPDNVRGNVSALSFFFDGEGYLFEYSVLFYGFYDSGQNETYFAPPHNPAPFIGNNYKLPLAYIFIIIFIFVISGGAILYSIAKKYKVIQRSKLGKRGQYIFAWRVFAGWDYAITDPKTAETKMKQHGIALKETLFETTKTRDTSPRSKIQRIVIHIITNSIVTILLFGSGYAIFVAAENAISAGGSFNLSDLGFNNLLQFFRSFQLQIVIVLRNFLIPLLFKFIALHEKYHPRTALKLRLLRLFVLYFSSLYVVMISLFILSRNCLDGNQEGICRCWETNVGQEMYKLMLIQTVTEVGSILLVEGIHWLFSKIVQRYFKASAITRLVGNVEFETSVGVLKLVYGQGLILFGVLFCPFLPAIGFMRNILIFYLRTVAVFVFDSPPQAFFRVASTHNFYMAILLVTVFISSLPVGFAMIEMVPSLRCGPFRGLDSMVESIAHDVDTWPDAVQTVLDYIQTATIIIPVITALCVVIYYYASLANALKDVNKDLLLQLTVEQSETKKILAEQVASDRRAKIMETVAYQATLLTPDNVQTRNLHAQSLQVMNQPHSSLTQLPGSHSANAQLMSSPTHISPACRASESARLHSASYVDAVTSPRMSSGAYMDALTTAQVPGQEPTKLTHSASQAQPSLSPPVYGAPKQSSSYVAEYTTPQPAPKRGRPQAKMQAPPRRDSSAENFPTRSRMPSPPSLDIPSTRMPASPRRDSDNIPAENFPTRSRMPSPPSHNIPPARFPPRSGSPKEKKSTTDLKQKSKTDLKKKFKTAFKQKSKTPRPPSSSSSGSEVGY